MELAARRFDGRKLKDLRNGKGWSQSQLGRRIGAHVTSISDWERGSNAPSGRHVAGLSREFGVPAESFYGDDDEEPSSVPKALTQEEYAMYGQLTAKIILGADYGSAFRTTDRTAA